MKLTQAISLFEKFYFRWEDRESPVNSLCASDDGSSDQISGNVNHKMVIHALKNRVRELEKESKSSSFSGGNHCLVCKVFSNFMFSCSRN